MLSYFNSDGESAVKAEEFIRNHVSKQVFGSVFFLILSVSNIDYLLYMYINIKYVLKS